MRKAQVVLRRNFRHTVVYPWQLPSIMRKHIYTGMMGSAYITLVTGILFVTYGNTIGMTPFRWGLMASISSFLLAAQLLSALITQSLGRRKLLWFVSAMACRSLRLVAILTSLWLWRAGSPHAAAALIVGVSLANFFGAVATPPWLSWLADLIPEREHGGFWGRRSAWIEFSIFCVILPAGLLVDRVPAEGKVNALVGVFLVGIAIGIVDLVIHGTLPEPAMLLPPRNHFVEQVLAPMRDRGFRPWLLFNLCWTFSMTLGGSLATVYFVGELGISKNLLGGGIVLTVFPMLGGMLTASRTGRLVDGVGPKRVLSWGHLFWALLPGLWVCATPGTALFWLGIAGLISGTASRAATTAANKLITRYPPAEDRAMYVAVSACLASLASGFGALTAGTVLHRLDGWTLTAWDRTFVPFHVLFVASLCLRLVSATLLLRRVQDPSPVEDEEPRPVIYSAREAS